MNHLKLPAWQAFFQDKHGHVAVWQWPNIPLYGWLLFKLFAALIAQPQLKHGFTFLSMSFLFAWAYLEITSGLSYFRRLLGFVVFISIILGYFRA